MITGLIPVREDRSSHSQVRLPFEYDANWSVTTFTLEEMIRYTNGFDKEELESEDINNIRVFKGNIIGRVDPLGRICSLNNTAILVKVFNAAKKRQQWQDELLYFSSYLSRYDCSPNFTEIIGKCETTKRLFLIHRFFDGRGNLSKNLSSSDLGWNEALKILRGITRVISKLHTGRETVLYNDFKPQKFWLTKEFQPIFHDCACATVPGNSAVDCFTPEYTEPILLKSCRPERKTDIFALGLLIFQVLMKVSADINAVFERLDLYNKNIGLPGNTMAHEDLKATGCSEEIDKSIVDLGCRCLAGIRGSPHLKEILGENYSDIYSRPSAEELVKCLQEIYTASSRPFPKKRSR